MGKRVKINGYRGRFSDFQGVRMTILCVFFALGAVLGHVLAHVSGCDRELTSQLQSYVLLDGFAITPANLLSVSKLYLSYPLAVVILGYCSFGAAVIPFVLAAQGFTFPILLPHLRLPLDGRVSFLLWRLLDCEVSSW